MHYLLFIVGLLNISLGIFVLAKNHKATANRLFFGLAILLFLWSELIAVYFLVENGVINISNYFYLINDRLIFSVSSFIPLFILLFSLNLLERRIKLYKKITLIMLFFIVSIISFFTSHSVNLEGIIEYNNMIYYIHITFFSFFYILSIYFLFIDCIKSIGVKKQKIKYFLIGFIICFIVGIVPSGIIPTIYKEMSLTWVGPVATFILLCFVTYLIVKYRFFDIKVVLRRGLVVGLILFIYAVAALIIGLAISGIAEVGLNYQTLIIIFLLILLTIFTIRPLKKSLDKLFLKEYYDLSVQMENLKSEFEAESTLEKLAIRVAQKSRDVLEIEDVYFFVYNQEKDKYITQFPRLGEVIFSSDDYLVKAFVEARKIIVEKEINYVIQEFSEKKELYKSARKVMKKLGIEVLIPLTLGGKYLGVLGFGKQIDRDLYSQDKLDRLEDFSKKLSVALAGVTEYGRTVDRIKNGFDKNI